MDEDFVIDDNGNPRIVEGIEELAQAITARLRTVLGEDPFEPLMGVSRPLPTGDAADAVIATTVRAAVLAEARVTAVTNLTVSRTEEEANSGAYTIEVDVESIDDELITVSEAF